MRSSTAPTLDWSLKLIVNQAWTAISLLRCKIQRCRFVSSGPNCLVPDLVEAFGRCKVQMREDEQGLRSKSNCNSLWICLQSRPLFLKDAIGYNQQVGSFRKSKTQHWKLGRSCQEGVGCVCRDTPCMPGMGPASADPWWGVTIRWAAPNVESPTFMCTYICITRLCRLCRLCGLCRLCRLIIYIYLYWPSPSVMDSGSLRSSCYRQ